MAKRKSYVDKAMENLKNKIDVRLLSNEEDYLKWTSKARYISQKTFDNNLVAVFKNKIKLTLRKPAYDRNSIMVKLKINMITTQDYYLLKLII